HGSRRATWHSFDPRGKGSACSRSTFSRERSSSGPGASGRSCSKQDPVGMFRRLEKLKGAFSRYGYALQSSRTPSRGASEFGDSAETKALCHGLALGEVWLWRTCRIVHAWPSLELNCRTATSIPQQA